MTELFYFEKQTKIDLIMGDCLEVLSGQENIYDAIITDPPYELSYMGKKWDNTGIAFSEELWSKLYKSLKPGGFLAAFGATRLYHRLACAAENSGFEIYPFMVWKFDGGLPKPANLSELFDRDNIENREIIGYRNGSGYTKANVDHGAQNRTTTQFPIYARNVSQEAQDWRGYYYGVNTLKPTLEPILMAQKPIETMRVIDSVRQWGVGALNIDILKEKYGSWQTNILEHKKAKKSDHQSDHISVKPIGLMEDLCNLLCPPGGLILDPFAGTGTTGIAAKKLGFNCVLIEQDQKMESVIKRRISL